MDGVDRVHCERITSPQATLAIMYRENVKEAASG
jgi:hypothetical protein